MKIIKVSTELEMSVHEFPSGTIREHNKALCELIGNGCDLVEHVMPKRLYTELKMPCTTRDTRNMEQAKWQPVLMLKKSKKLQCRRFWHCSRS